MNVSNAARSLLSNVPGANQAIDFLCARINEVFSAQHDNETGAHTTITADSLEVTGEDPSTFGGAGTFDGNVTADADQDPVEIGRALGTVSGTEAAIGNGLSVRCTPTQAFGFDWIARNATFKEIVLQWRTASTSAHPLRVRLEVGTPSYHIMPGPLTNAAIPVYLGSPTDSFRGGCFAGVYANAFYRNDLAVAEGDYQTYTPTLTNITLGNGTLTAKWAQVGHVTFVEVTLVFGTTTTIAATATISTPTSNTAQSGVQPIGRIGMVDTSLGAFYEGPALAATATSIALYNSATPLVAVGAAVPFLWADTDKLLLNLAYQNT